MWKIGIYKNIFGPNKNWTVSCTGTGMDQNFIIGCRYFLKKCKLPVQTKTLLFVASIFLVVIFLFPCDIVVICVFVLPIEWWWFNIFLFFVLCMGLQGCCCVLNPKSTRGVTHFLVWWGITISPTCMHISVRIFGWMVRSLD